MTNYNTPFNNKVVQTGNDSQIYTEKFYSAGGDQEILFPKLRSTLAKNDVDIITFEVDFKKLDKQIAFYQNNVGTKK